MLKNWKSLFIEEDESPKSKAPKQKPKAKETATPTPSAPKQQAVNVGPGQVTEKFTDILLTAMEKADLEGFDYLEYKKSLHSLKKMSMDEATRYQSAFAMGQTMGATPESLVKTAQHYLEALLQEEKKFEAALNNQREKKIGNKRLSQQQLKQTIANKEAQIAKLQTEINEHKGELNQLENDIQESVSSIEQTKNDFFASYQNLVKKIQADITKMKQYLK